MSKARLIITAVIVEGRSQREVARAYGGNQSWVSRLVAATAPRARPRSSPAHAAQDQPDGDPTATVALITELRDKRTTAGLTPGRTPSPGTSPTTTASASWQPPAAAT